MKSLATILIISLTAIGNTRGQKVFKVKYESQAGWRNQEKQHLLL